MKLAGVHNAKGESAPSCMHTPVPPGVAPAWGFLGQEVTELPFMHVDRFQSTAHTGSNCGSVESASAGTILVGPTLAEPKRRLTSRRRSSVAARAAS
eukprot:scaffold237658_cov35-Tisochrysis_lutea.AAC.2